MAAPVRTPRDSWIEEGLKALGVGGPDAVRVEKLADALGVTKGGFYWHFDDRRALLEEMLDASERLMIDDVIERVERGGGNATARLRRLSALAGSGRGLVKIDLAIRDWARRDKAVERRLRRLDNRRMEYLRSLFREISNDPDQVEVRSLLLLSLWIGNALIAADHGAVSRSEVMVRALDWLQAQVLTVGTRRNHPIAGYVDTHTHLLPEIDERCPDLEHPLAIARAATESGIAHELIEVAPQHVHPHAP